MKKQLFVFAGLFIITVALVSWNSRSTTYEGAFIDKDFGCGLMDGDGGFVVSTSSHTVVNDDGTVLKCSVKKVTNSTGKAVEYAGFYCGTYLGSTTNSKETVSASGNATLTCELP